MAAMSIVFCVSWDCVKIRNRIGPFEVSVSGDMQTVLDISDEVYLDLELSVTSGI